MREFAKSFYKSKGWKQTREAYAESVAHLCERCGEPGEIVHHKIKITPRNINNPNIALDWNNLQMVCRKCHAELHQEEYEKMKKPKVKPERKKPVMRYEFGPNGEVISPPRENFEGAKRTDAEI